MIRPPLFFAVVQRQPRHLPPRLEFDELFEDEFELELFDEFDELLLDEFELELLEEFELEFDEPFDDELDELLPATMMEPSLLATLVCGRSGAVEEYSFASAAVVASAATPATSADLNFQCLVMAVTPLFRTALAVRGSNGTGGSLFHRIKGRLSQFSLPRIAESASASSSDDSGSPASIAER